MSHRTTAHLLSLAIIGTGALSLPATDQVLSAEPVANIGTEYRLFVGLDVEVGEGDEYALVEGYVNNRVHTDGSKGLVSLRNVDDVRFTHKTKISRNPLTIENLHTEQISANVHAARDAMRNQQSLNAYRNQMTAGLISDLRAAGDPEIGADGAPVVNLSPAPNQGALDAQAALSDFGSMTNESTFTDEIIGRDNDKSTAMLITAEVSSPTHIDDAYIVGVATISTDESPEEEVIFFNRIGSLDQKPVGSGSSNRGCPINSKCETLRSTFTATVRNWSATNHPSNMPSLASRFTSISLWSGYPRIAVSPWTPNPLGLWPRRSSLPPPKRTRLTTP
ncbi:MAG: hypothetical protein ACKVI3_06530 [Verrucomicrobiia bacterium]